VRALVTGATGFTGGHLARHLSACGHPVRVLVRKRDRARDLEAQDQLAGAIAEYRLASEMDPTNTLAMAKANELERRQRERVEASRPPSQLDQLRAQARQSSTRRRRACWPRAPSCWSRWPGWWNHGDWASVDADGCWFLHGRADESMNVAGRKVGPAEVEDSLIV
jgi:acyl-CoA synthetase (AMP-forming)/AMP-acid ligase II